MHEAQQVETEKTSLSLMLDRSNCIVIATPSGETVELYLSKKHRSGYAGVTIRAARQINIFRKERQSHDRK
jgi:hypothetical protein